MTWQPGPKTRLTLKQLGFSRTQVAAVQDEYQRACEDTKQPCRDVDFMRFFQGSASISDQQYQHLNEQAQLPVQWQPAPEAKQALTSKGYDMEAISHYANLFALKAREQQLLIEDPDRLFMAFCADKPKTLAAPLPNNWLPDRQTLEKLSKDRNSDDFTLAIERFITGHQHRMARDWNALFSRWFQQGQS